MSSFDSPEPVKDDLWTAPPPAVDGAIEAYNQGARFTDSGVAREKSMTVKKGQKTSTESTKLGAELKDKGVDLSRSTSRETVYSPRVSKKDSTTTGVEIGAGRGIVSRSSETTSKVGEREIASGRGVKLGYDDGVLAESERHSSIKDAKGGTEDSRKLAVKKGKLTAESAHADTVIEKVGDEEVTTKASTKRGLEAGKGGAVVSWGTGHERSAKGGKDGAQKDSTNLSSQLGWDGDHVVAGRQSTMKSETDHGSTTDTASVQVKNGKLSIDNAHEETTKRTIDGKEYTTKDSSSQGLEVGKDGAVASWNKGYEDGQAGDKQSEQKTSRLGYQNGHIVADRQRSTSVADADGNQRTETSGFGLEGGKAKYSRGSSRETVRVVDGEKKTSSKGSETNVKVDKDSIAAARTLTKVNEQGTKRSTTLGAQLDKNNASVNAGHTITTKNGNSFTASVKAGITVWASEPQKVGDKFVVTYTSTTAVGGAVKGGAKVGPVSVGVSASGSASDIDSGSRTFATEKEAQEFKKHAADRIRETGDPRTLKGALAMEIGESRGHGSALEGALAGSVGAYGVSLGAGAEKKSSDALDVRRLSANLFEVTFVDKSESKKHLDVHAPILDGSQGTKSAENSELVVQFDLATPDGQAAFTQFCADHQLPAKGAKLVKREKGSLGETFNDFSLMGGFSSHSHGRTWEKDTVDDKGHHEEYGGERASSQSAGWIGHHITGDKDMSRAVQVVSRQEDDTASEFAIRGTFGGESGEHIRGGMQHLFGPKAYGESWDPRHGKTIEDNPSGEWTMTADVDPKAMLAMAQRSPALKGKSLDEQMKAIAKLVADGGIAGIRALDESLDGGLSWNVELKGDRNFPGKAGRQELDAKIAGFTALLDASEDAAGATVLEPIAQALSSLRFRRDGVADPQRYLDLPDAMRAAELLVIDQQLAKLEQLRHRAAISAVKNNAGEAAGDIGLRVANPDGYAGMEPAQAELARLRDRIALEDAAILGYQRQSEEASIALQDGIQGGRGIDWEAEKARDLGGMVSRKSGEAGVLNQQQTKEYLELDRLRMAFSRSLTAPGGLPFAGEPNPRAVELGQQLLGELKKQTQLAFKVESTFHEAATGMVQIIKSNAAAKHAAFWADVADSV